jgi:hypothetical protein
MGKLQKMEALYTHSSKSPSPFPKLPKIHFLKIKKIQKNWDSPTGPGVDPRPAGDSWSPAVPRPPTCGRRLLVAKMPATSGRGQATRSRPLVSGMRSTPGPVELCPFLLKFFSSYPPHFAQVVNSFSLAAAHALPAHTSP